MRDATGMLARITGAASALGALVITLAASHALAQSTQVYTPPGYGTGVVVTVTPAPQPAPVYVAPSSARTYVPVTYTPIAPPQRARTSSIRSLWIPGLIGLPAAWVITWVVASVDLPVGASATSFAYIPLVGPWLMLGEPMNGSEAFYIAMGVIQDVSLLCLVLGLTIRIPEQAPDSARSTGLTFAAAPTVGGGMLRATLTF